jgi:hypothetical protein
MKAVVQIRHQISGQQSRVLLKCFVSSQHITHMRGFRGKFKVSKRSSILYKVAAPTVLLPVSSLSFAA